MKTLYLILACFMNSATMIAIGALIISFLSLIFTVKTYKKNRRLEFLQRKDHLSQKISDLNARNSEAHLISARFGLVALKNAGLSLSGEQAEQNTALIASINKQRDFLEDITKLWEETIESLHLKNNNLNLETDSPEVEKMIANVQVASDKLKNVNDAYISSLHTLETINEFIKTNLTEKDEKIRQINIDFEREIRQINIDFEREIRQINIDFERAVKKLNNKKLD